MSAENPFLLHVDQDSVVIPARLAALLEARTNIAKLRAECRGRDHVMSTALHAIRLSAMSWDPSQTSAQTEGDVDRKPARESEWMTTTEVAKGLGITSQAVRKAIKEGRLRGQLKGNRFRVRRTDYQHWKTARAD